VIKARYSKEHLSYTYSLPHTQATFTQQLTHSSVCTNPGTLCDPAATCSGPLQQHTSCTRL